MLEAPVPADDHHREGAHAGRRDAEEVVHRTESLPVPPIVVEVEGPRGRDVQGDKAIGEAHIEQEVVEAPVHHLQYAFPLSYSINLFGPTIYLFA